MGMDSSYQIRLADLNDSQDANDILFLLNQYSEHPMGQSGPLPDDVQDSLIDGLRRHPTSLVFIAKQWEEDSEKPVGLASCFQGFSTFKAKPLINIHDLFVTSSARGQGLGAKIIDAVAGYARERGCCAVTLEVRADNVARKLYQKKGFEGLQEDQGREEHLMLFGKLTLS